MQKISNDDFKALDVIEFCNNKKSFLYDKYSIKDIYTLKCVNSPLLRFDVPKHYIDYVHKKSLNKMFEALDGAIDKDSIKPKVFLIDLKLNIDARYEGLIYLNYFFDNTLLKRPIKDFNIFFARDFRSKDRYYINDIFINSIFKIDNDYLEQGKFLGDAMEHNAGSLFFAKAIKRVYKIKGMHALEYKPFYTLPTHIKKRLDEINKDKDSIENQEKDSLVTARFYHKVATMQDIKKEQESLKQKFLRNLKIAFIVLIVFGAYYYYNENFSDNINSVEDMKRKLPLKLDAHTTLAHINDTDNDFVMTVIKDAEAFSQMDAQKRDEVLDAISKNAHKMCKNPLIGSIVSSGRKVTVLLQASDLSFERKILIDKCEKRN